LQRLVDFAAFLDNCKNITKDLTWVFVVSQCVDRRDTGKFRELLDVALRVSPNDSAVDHSSEHARSILNQFTPAQLCVGRVQINRFASEFPDANFKRNTRPS
jgi:hypothetical protein